MRHLQIWTDGSCTPSNGNGGIGVVFVYEGQVVHEVSKGFPKVTNNQMEILAILEALTSITIPLDKLEVFTDSQYCVGMLTKNWKASANVGLWEQVSQEVLRVRGLCKDISFIHTKGHASDAFNNRADLLATVASGYRNAPVDFKLVRYAHNSNDKPKPMPPLVIALDFDGTVVEHRYPEIGGDIGAVPVLKALQSKGHQFILYTMRDNHSGDRNCLKEAADWFRSNGINLLGINCNPWQKSWTDSPKVYAPVYIDDAALGAPVLQHNQFSRPYIDWVRVVDWFHVRGYLNDQEADELCEQVVKLRKK